METSPSKKSKKVKRNKRYVTTVDFDIPGVKRLSIYPEAQKSLSCTVGPDVSEVNPWKYLVKNDVINYLKTFRNNSDFLSIVDDLLIYEGDKILLGYIPNNDSEEDEFFMCLTKEAEKIISKTITQVRQNRQAMLEKITEKRPKPWKSQGSESYVDLLQTKNNRPLLGIEYVSDYPLKIQPPKLKLRFSHDVRDGYVEFLTGRLVYDDVILRKIDNFVQVGSEVKTNEAQTVYTYPKNDWTQYECKSLEKFDEDLENDIQTFLEKNISEISEKLVVNSKINFYTNDYSSLVLDEKFTKVKDIKVLQEYTSLVDIGMKTAGLSISSASWHPMWTGTIAVSYSTEASSTYRKSKATVDEVNRTIYELYPVLVWSFQDKLYPNLYLETQREVSFVSFCPYDENILVGGCINGQIIIWDLKSKLQQIENERVLNLQQQKIRKHIFSLVGWMKANTNLKFVRPTVVSNLQLSHTSAVTSIKWMSPYREINRCGQILEVEDIANRDNLTFLSASRDGSVLVWNLNTESQLVVDTKITLAPEISPLKELNPMFSPIFKITLHDPTNSNIILPISSLSFRSTLPNYVEISPTPNRKIDISERIVYKPIFNKPTHSDTSKLVIGTTEGDFITAEWESFEYDPEEILNVQTASIKSIGRYHDGPVVSVTRSQNVPDLFLTVGGKIFALWKEGCPNKPVMWRRSKCRYTGGTWNIHRPSMFRLTRCDGCMEVWILSQRTDEYLNLKKLSPYGLSGTYISPLTIQKNIVGIADGNCALRVFNLDTNVLVEDDRLAVVKLFDREMNRKQVLEKWQKEWVAKNIPPKVVEPKRPYRREYKRSKSKDGKSLKSKEFLQEQRALAEKERLSQILLQKKRLDVELLYKKQVPLIEMKKDLNKRDEKQKEALKLANEILTKTIDIEFPDILKKPKPPTPDPYSYADASEENVEHYKQYQKIQTEFEEFVDRNKFEYDFDWIKIVGEGRNRSKFLDPSYNSITHRFRKIEKKIRKPQPVSEDVVAETVPKPPKIAPTEVLAAIKKLKKKKKSAKTVCLSRLKETVAPSECDRTLETRISEDFYPFATVLRLRVLQIVCGISFLVVGTVAFIEERGELNLSLGIPAGGTTILAAAASIHTTKGFGGYKASNCAPDSPFRFLGPTLRIAVPVAILWGSTCSFVAAVIIQAIKTLIGLQTYDLYEETVPEDVDDITILAIVELVLSAITLLSVLSLLRIDCKFDPD